MYYLASSALGLVSGLVMAHRVRTGREDKARLNERHARNLPARPQGRLAWLHGASVGESLILLEVGRRLQTRHPGLQLLYTSQTQTSARLMAARLPANARHQMAPIDTPRAARRFIAHWQPGLVIIAEGEIWPNLLTMAKQADARLALINARMTEKSLSGWARWPRTAGAVFGRFDLILAADKRTATGLTKLTGRSIHSPGNLKTALPPPDADATELAELRRRFLHGRPCFLAASTHAGEEALFLDAANALSPRPALIIVPRHPERGDEIDALVRQRGLSLARRSRGEMADQATDVLLADTLGEMGLWYRLADAVYLGGGHAEHIGGHNPLEPLQLERPVITGPVTYNFADLMPPLIRANAVRQAGNASELAMLAQSYLTGDDAVAIDRPALSAFFADAEAPMTETVRALRSLLPTGADA